MPLLCVIPARIGATRLPEKPLRKIAGKPLIRLVAERVISLDLGGEVVVATDDFRILDAVEGLDVTAVMTDPSHRSGTERIAEVLARPEYAGVDVVLNVQGDEPFVSAAAVRGALQRVRTGDSIGTAAVPIPPERAGDPNRVKVTIDRNGHATRFSRAPLPSAEGVPSEYLQHVGVYAYSRRALLDWVRLAPVAEEITERLEQLRPLAYGMRLGVHVISDEAFPGIDTEEDLVNAEAHLTGRGREVTA
jgi:3-deoxy-manno-octulosonate cytidylyltransferase (CMP-KDO synthetase)